MNPSQEKSTTYGCKISGSPFVKIVIIETGIFSSLREILRAMMSSFGFVRYGIGFGSGNAKAVPAVWVDT